MTTTHSICQCGCGLRAKSGKRFRKYHNLSADGRALRWTGLRYEYNYRLVMEAHLGRKLRPGECVHHKNGNRNDDRVDNLTVHESQSSHMLIEHSPNWMVVPCAVCEQPHRNTIRRKYPLCSRECRKNWKPPGAPITTGVGVVRELLCHQCGKAFLGKRSRARAFCSRQCYAQSLKCPAGRKSDSRIVAFRGNEMTVAELSRVSGIGYKTLHTRLRAGWEVEDAVSKPIRDSGR